MKRAASKTPGVPPAGLGIKYDHDLDVSEAFLQGFPSIREALKDERLLQAFYFYDGEARAHKRAFQLLGLWSLMLGLVPLIVAASRMIAGEPAFSHVAEINIAAELCGLRPFVSSY